MKTFHILPRPIRDYKLLIFSLLLVGYFTLHAFDGDASVKTLQKLEEQEKYLHQIADSTKTTRARIETRVAAMEGQNIDPDLLEEEVRDKLGLAHPDEVVLFIK